MFGKDVKSSEVNSHKKMAGAMMSGNFGVQKHPGNPTMHPDVGMKHDAMSDGSRGAGPGIGSGMAKQAAPDHGMGSGMKDSWNRAGKL